MKAAYDVGINFFDCAEGYAGGESERVMGETIKKFGWKRNDIVVSTKVRETCRLTPRVPVRCGAREQGLCKEHYPTFANILLGIWTFLGSGPSWIVLKCYRSTGAKRMAITLSTTADCRGNTSSRG